MESRSKFLKVRDCEKMPKYMIDILVSLVLSLEITDKNREKNTYLSMKDTLDYLKSFLDGYGLKEAFLTKIILKI